MTRRIKVKGIRKEVVSASDLAMVYWLLGKAAVEDKRRREAEAKQDDRETAYER
jgi:hypothetical protein